MGLYSFVAAWVCFAVELSGAGWQENEWGNEWGCALFRTWVAAAPRNSENPARAERRGVLQVSTNLRTVGRARMTRTDEGIIFRADVFAYLFLFLPLP